MPGGLANRLLAPFLAASLAVVACAAPQPPAAGGTAPGGAASTASAATSATAFRGTKSFTFPFSSPGISDVPLRAAVARLNAEGWDIEITEIPQPDILIQGLTRGEFSFSTESTSGALVAAKQGLPVRIVASYARNAWTMYSTEEIAECADLDGKTIAIHSEAASTTAMQRAWMEQECPEAEPQIVIIEGSPNRAAALLAGEIDATALELADTVALEADDEQDRFHLLTSFAEGLPRLHPSTIYTTQEFLDANPDTVKGLIRALLEEHRKIAEDPGYLKQIALKHYPEIDQDTVDEVVQLYTERNIFPVNGEITAEDLEYTIDFYESTGIVEEGLAAEDVAGLGPLEEVLSEIGRQ